MSDWASERGIQLAWGSSGTYERAYAIAQALREARAAALMEAKDVCIQGCGGDLDFAVWLLNKKLAAETEGK